MTLFFNSFSIQKINIDSKIYNSHYLAGFSYFLIASKVINFAELHKENKPNERKKIKKF